MSREGDAVDTLLCVKEVMPDIAASDGDVSPTCTVKIYWDQLILQFEGKSI